MTAIKLNQVTKTFPSNTLILNEINLLIESGELVVFIGSSGCGKSTLLRLIAGLDTQSGGDIWFDDHLMNEVPPGKREVGMVFQSYALYPHMTVKENLSFGLKQKKISKLIIEEKINQVAQTLEIDGLLDLKPEALSGGQQQRVAIGRCIVQTPKLFLFDEPLSNLDAELRVKTRREIRGLHKKLNATMIYVTHDQVEAMTLADKIAVFAPLSEYNSVNLQQFGSPLELYNQPANKFVAGFLGTPKINFILATISQITASAFEIKLQNSEFLIVKARNEINTDELEIGQTVELAIRPEHLFLDSNQGDTSINADYETRELLGAETLIYFNFGGTSIAIKCPDQIVELNPNNKEVALYFNLINCFVFDQRSGKRLV